MKRFILGVCALIIVMPSVSLAQGSRGVPDDFVGPPTAEQASSVGTKLQSPLKGANGGEIKDVGGLFKDILGGIIIPLTLAVGVLFIILAGLKFVTATGNPEKLKVAKQNLLYTVIGVAVVLSAEILLNILLATLREIGNVG